MDIRLSTAVVNLGLPFEQNIVLRKDLTLVIIRHQQKKSFKLGGFG